MVYFREVQYFRQPWLVLLLATIIVLFGYGLYQQLVLDQPFGNRPMSDAALITVTLGVVLSVAWLLNMHLVTEVRDDEFLVKFILMWPRKQVPYREIRSAEAVTYRPILDYGGWGVRWGRKGRAWNVSGNRGVQLVFADGRRLLVGSQRPQELAGAIQERMGNAAQ